ncbi:MAG: hypothetical protein HKN43_13635 [Rhodothermales bacterium]|nr:hypothetical protein [Rhodothermales bacterium]
MINFFTQYEIPYFHPLVVHFPVAMLLAAVIFAALWAVRGHARWFTVYVSMHVIGTLGAIAAFRTGEALADDTEGVPIVEELVGTHELYGKITMIAAIIVSLILLYLVYARSKKHPWADSSIARYAMLILSIATALITILTAHLGGIMVWGIPL